MRKRSWLTTFEANISSAFEEYVGTPEVAVSFRDGPVELVATVKTLLSMPGIIAANSNATDAISVQGSTTVAAQSLH
jgi:hypothetical protein